MSRQAHRNPDCSVYVGNLSNRATEELLWELFLQAGPVQSVYIPCDKETGKQKGFGFIQFTSSVSAHYAWELLDGIKLFDSTLTVRPQQNNSSSSNSAPKNKMAANYFYGEFYSKLYEHKRRPQSEPRRNRREEDNHYHNRRNSYCPPLNRSMSSPAQAQYFPHWQQIQANISPMTNNIRAFLLPTPPNHPDYRR